MDSSTSSGNSVSAGAVKKGDKSLFIEAERMCKRLNMTSSTEELQSTLFSSLLLLFTHVLLEHAGSHQRQFLDFEAPIRQASEGPTRDWQRV